MKILIFKDDSSNDYTALNESFARAFKKHSAEIHKIIIFESMNYFLVNSYLTSKIAAGFIAPKIQSKLLRKIEEINPDVILVIKGAFLLPSMLKKIRKTFPQIKVACYNPDDPFSKYRGAANQYIRDSIKYYDHYFTWKKSLTKVLEKLGAKRAHYMPFAADTDIIYPVKADENDSYNDVTFIGNPDLERKNFVNRLLSEFSMRGLNVPINIYGAGWQNQNGLIVNGQIEGNKFLQTITSSKINLNILRKQNKNSNNMRTFEIPAAGGFMLHEYSEEAMEFFKPGIEADYFRDEKECADKILFYLKNDELRKKIAEAGTNKIKDSGFTYFERIAELLSILTKN